MDNYAACQYCGKLNKAKRKASKKACPLCLFWHKRIKNKTGLSFLEKKAIVNKLASLPQACSSCESKTKLTVDRIVPASNGGVYSPENVQILCYQCNCCIKTNLSSVNEAKTKVISRTCLKCGKVKPLSSKFFSPKGYIPKYRTNSLSMYKNICKPCVVARSRKYPKKCLKCSNAFMGFKSTSKFCSVSCAKTYRDGTRLCLQ